ncbi:MAG: hypothetical protein KTR16_11470 [Acidiferrobacterales bacterium]|nr:hypothetical protein [Acidiferrobacterales bacterium]
MFFKYDHSDLGKLEVMVTDYDKEADIITFEVCDQDGDEVDHSSFKGELEKIAYALKDDAEAQQQYEDLIYGC